MLTFIVAAFAELPLPINFDRIGLERAKHLDSRLVQAAFVNVAPASTLAGRTVIGPANRDRRPAARIDDVRQSPDNRHSAPYRTPARHAT